MKDLIQPSFDELCDIGGFRGKSFEEKYDTVGLRGWGLAALYGEEGELKQLDAFKNLISNVGDQYYGGRAANIGTLVPQAVGMQLGTGVTAVAKNGAGAGIVTVVNTTNAYVAFDATYPSSTGLQAGAVAYLVQWKTTFAAGIATANGISEVIIGNQAIGTQTAVPVANTISRALLGTVVNKAAGDSLAITWNHNVLGA